MAHKEMKLKLKCDSDTCSRFNIFCIHCDDCKITKIEE